MASESTGKRGRRLQIGQYQVVRHVATGGMGAVYRAEHVGTGQVVALKVLSPDLATNPVMLTRFRREAGHALKVKHEHIVELYEWGQANGVYFLALEFVDGIDLHEYIERRGQLEIQEARELLTQAAKALDHLHSLGIVHRDVKPSNFLVSRRDGEPWLKLIDLGLAREVKDEEFRLTRASYTLGTVDYMSPEQARDSGRADIRSDIYSLGCTFYHMLSGRPPFGEGSLTERILAHREDDAPDVHEFNPRVPARALSILKRMLAKHPDDRYQTPAELLNELEPASRNSDSDVRDVLATLAAEDEWREGSRPELPIRRPRPGSKPKTPAEKDTKEMALKDTEEMPTERQLFGVRIDQEVLFWSAIAAGTLFLVIALVLIFIHHIR